MARTEFPTKATHAQTRAHNAGLALRAIHDLGPISRADIARLTGLTRTSVCEVVGELKEDGPAQEVGRCHRPSHRDLIGQPDHRKEPDRA